MTPICEGVRPFLASLVTWSPTSAGVVFSHDGGVRRYGRADLEIPFLRGERCGREARQQQSVKEGARQIHDGGREGRQQQQSDQSGDQ